MRLRAIIFKHVIFAFYWLWKISSNFPMALLRLFNIFVRKMHYNQDIMTFFQNFQTKWPTFLIFIILCYILWKNVSYSDFWYTLKLNQWNSLQNTWGTENAIFDSLVEKLVLDSVDKCEITKKERNVLYNHIYD